MKRTTRYYQLEAMGHRELDRVFLRGTPPDLDPVSYTHLTLPTILRV